MTILLPYLDLFILKVDLWQVSYISQDVGVYSNCVKQCIAHPGRPLQGLLFWAILSFEGYF